MKIEVWSDFMCPFCYIGKRRLEEALENFGHRDDVEIVFRSFELDPDAPRAVDYDIHDAIAAKYGLSRAQAEESNRNLSAQAKEVGLDYHIDSMVLTNSFDAHRLAQYAKENGKMDEVTERLFKAVFVSSESIGEHEQLISIAQEVGLNLEEVKAVLESDRFADEVKSDEREAEQLGVRGVPFFVINRKYGISGAQPSPIFRDALNKVWEEEHPLSLLVDPVPGADGCVDGVCAPKKKS